MRASGKRDRAAIAETKDAANAAEIEATSGLELLTELELNNKLIREAYAVSKRREYVQHLIGDVDMSILDTETSKENAFQAYTRVLEHIKQAGLK
jgi:hypothetical protein